MNIRICLITLFMISASQPIAAMVPQQTKDEQLIAAAEIGNKELVVQLLSQGANINWQDKLGDTALKNAVYRHQPDIIKLLLEHSADINIKDYKGWTPLRAAIFADNPNIVKLLLDYGADVNTKDNDGLTPLRAAISQNRANMVKLLLEHGAHGADANINIKDHREWTPVRDAVYRNRPDIVKLLLDHDADVNIKDNNGLTPLMIAATMPPIIATFTKSHRLEIAKLLLDAGANRFLKNKDGKTAIDIAIKNKFTEIADLIRNFKETPRSLLQQSVDKVALQIISGQLTEADAKKSLPTDLHKELEKALARLR